MRTVISAVCAVLLLLALALALIAPSSEPDDSLYVAPTVLPDVIRAHYGKSLGIACNTWDMEIYGDRLYVSTGDYGRNSGRTPLFSYDIALGEWVEPYITNDEALGDMRNIDGDLFIMGNDSCGSWDFANLYVVTPEGVEMRGDIPRGVHLFDVIRVGDATFFGIGTAGSDESPVLLYDGENYTSVDFYKDGESVLSDTTRLYHRAYNFFYLEGELYAFLYSEVNEGLSCFEMYRLSDGRFEYFDTIRGKGVGFYVIEERRLFQNPFRAALCGDSVLISTGRLYRTADLHTYEELFPPVDAVTDIYTDSGEVFLLGFTDNGDGSYTNSILCMSGDGFTEIKRFKSYGAYALSLACDSESFFVGLGGVRDSDESGYILRVER